MRSIMDNQLFSIPKYIYTCRSKVSQDPIRYITNAVAVIVSILFSVKFIALSKSNVINYYPFITSDGFDWYIEGIYLNYLGVITNLPSLPVLRPPGFVTLTYLDSLIYQGLVVGIAFGICLGATYFITLKLIDIISPNKSTSNLLPPIILILLTIHPANYIKKYLLSDSIAVTLGLLAVYLLCKFYSTDKRAYLLSSALVAFGASITQTYALIPYLIFSCCLIFASFKHGQNYVRLAAYSLTVITMYIITTFVWRSVIPHGMTPTNFELLKFTFAMSNFYLNTWGIFLIPLIPLFLGLQVKTRGQINSTLYVPLALTVVIFALLCFFYQWREARFTYYFWPWLLILIGPFLKIDLTKKNVIAVLVCGLASVLISPREHWVPKLNQISIAPHSNWLIQYARSSSVDRKLSNCTDPSCLDNEFVSNADNYVKSTLKVYQTIMLELELNRQIKNSPR